MSDWLDIVFGMTVDIDSYLDWEAENCMCDALCSCRLPWEGRQDG